MGALHNSFTLAKISLGGGGPGALSACGCAVGGGGWLWFGWCWSAICCLRVGGGTSDYSMCRYKKPTNLIYYHLLLLVARFESTLSQKSSFFLLYFLWTLAVQRIAWEKKKTITGPLCYLHPLMDVATFSCIYTPKISTSWVQ